MKWCWLVCIFGPVVCNFCLVEANWTYVLKLSILSNGNSFGIKEFHKFLLGNNVNAPGRRWQQLIKGYQENFETKIIAQLVSCKKILLNISKNSIKIEKI